MFKTNVSLKKHRNALKALAVTNQKNRGIEFKDERDVVFLVHVLCEEKRRGKNHLRQFANPVRIRQTLP